VLGCLSSFGEGYRRALWSELDRMGMQMMLVPLGCPYDAAARVLKGHTLDNSLPDDAVGAARRDPAVAVAAPLLMAAVPRQDEGRTDLWVGLDRSAVALKPWWRARAGKAWFPSADSVILGSEAAETEMRDPGDRLYSPETGAAFRVAGVLAPSGTSDDSLFFVPLATAQKMFHQPHRLTAVAIRLKDPAMLRDAAERLQRIPGAQVVTLTEMMGTFLNLVGSVRALMLAIAAVALAASMLGVFNTLFSNLIAQTPELALMRAIGASRFQILTLVSLQAILIAVAGSAAGLLMAACGGRLFETALRGAVEFTPTGSFLVISPLTAVECLAMGLGSSLLGALYPAWRAIRLAPARAGNTA
jgi:putative ABC transport system permease protein